MARCCVMKAYFRPDTRANQIAWGIFATAVVTGAILVPLGASRMTDCAGQWNTCVVSMQRTYMPDPEEYCRPILYQCHFAQWYNTFMWGIFLFFLAGGVLCYFCCCAVPPGYSPGGATYSVTGTYQVGQPVGANPYESTPLFHTAVYSSTPHIVSPYGAQQLPPPPPYQYAQLYPTHAPDVQMQSFVPPTYTITLAPEAQPPVAVAYDPSFSGGVHPVLGPAPAPQPFTPSAGPPQDPHAQIGAAHTAPYQQQQHQRAEDHASAAYPTIPPASSTTLAPAANPSHAVNPSHAQAGAQPQGHASDFTFQEQGAASAGPGAAGGVGASPAATGAAAGVTGAGTQPAGAAAAAAAPAKPVPDLLL